MNKTRVRWIHRFINNKLSMAKKEQECNIDAIRGRLLEHANSFQSTYRLTHIYIILQGSWIVVMYVCNINVSFLNDSSIWFAA